MVKPVKVYYKWMHWYLNDIRVPGELAGLGIKHQSLALTKHESKEEAHQFLRNWGLTHTAEEQNWFLCKLTIEVINE